jgi:hypothetical protein
MKLGMTLALALCLSLPLTAQAGGSAEWLRLLNAESGRTQPLVESQVRFAPVTSEMFPGLVAVGYRQSDETYTLGSLIWEGKAWSPMQGYARILDSLGFREADDARRQELFSSLLQNSNAPLGVHLYDGKASREADRPAPMSSQRQIDGQQRVTAWFWKEPGAREGVEWRQVFYQIDPAAGRVKVKTLGTYYPDSEGLRGFPSTSSGSSE